jgi:hypothetical protein
MAITKAHPGLKVVITVDGAAREEFIDEDEEESRDSVTKYIEAVSGAVFSVDLEVSKPWPGTGVLYHIYTDGKWMRGTFVMQKDYTGSSVKVSVPGVQYLDGGRWLMQKFCFSDLVVGTQLAAMF